MKSTEEVTINHVMLNYRQKVSIGGLNSVLGGRHKVLFLGIISLQITKMANNTTENIITKLFKRSDGALKRE